MVRLPEISQIITQHIHWSSLYLSRKDTNNFSHAVDCQSSRMGCCCSKSNADPKGKGKAKAVMVETITEKKRVVYDPSSDSGEMPAEEFWPPAGEAGPSDWREARRRERRRVLEQANRRKQNKSSQY
ncbi:hypothetical protein PpBr36_05385 [Pyricularia pennisetigena]|uniref:hypothetical protein n=1 Tax=Pyricularia pennisetigena TaxID=1578925 RepID=UPI0011504EC5|nr:hypothetical protein PpBr36_05385 [Pyricularia pennisetigena]TLS26711.1 hypothetical protein PpBr36_05385 [Pyricularia pennisetigena]